MNTPEIAIIAAISENRVIGKDGKIPWRIPEDLKRFKELTLRHPVIMGRKTWDSLPIKPLPERFNIIISHQALTLPNTEGMIGKVSALDTAIRIASGVDQEKVFIMGGSEIYQQSLSFVDRLYLTLVEENFEGDAFFPDYSEFKKVVSEEPGESNGLKYKFLTLERENGNK